MLQPLKEEELNEIYTWVDQIPLSRPKKNIARDFADGILMAEIMHYFLPKLVDMHNYSQANSVKQKKYNWDTLNTKVFKRIGFTLSKEQVDSVISCQSEAIERVLKFVQAKLEYYLENNTNSAEKLPQQGDSQIAPPPLLANEWQKDQQIFELRETVEVLEQKLHRMDELMKQKDAKILRYQQLLQQNGLL
ncbi:unnamed protein product [Paramecium octaurelia]|uniref:Calponin-homology (CH) domain-containing protein n=1 Tax=Paramecium octaurelia TaxID=43137 RepID=A0A8S1SZI4_PAROT|nr:unnamed protein product [Paramecium octaurelia]